MVTRTQRIGEWRVNWVILRKKWRLSRVVLGGGKKIEKMYRKKCGHCRGTDWVLKTTEQY